MCCSYYPLFTWAKAPEIYPLFDISFPLMSFSLENQNVILASYFRVIFIFPSVDVLYFIQLELNAKCKWIIISQDTSLSVHSPSKLTWIYVDVDNNVPSSTTICSCSLSYHECFLIAFDPYIRCVLDKPSGTHYSRLFSIYLISTAT